MVHTILTAVSLLDDSTHGELGWEDEYLREVPAIDKSQTDLLLKVTLNHS